MHETIYLTLFTERNIFTVSSQFTLCSIYSHRTQFLYKYRSYYTRFLCAWYLVFSILSLFLSSPVLKSTHPLIPSSLAPSSLFLSRPLSPLSSLVLLSLVLSSLILSSLALSPPLPPLPPARCHLHRHCCHRCCCRCQQPQTAHIRYEHPWRRALRPVDCNHAVFMRHRRFRRRGLARM